MAPTPENAPCWHIPVRPREIYIIYIYIYIYIYISLWDVGFYANTERFRVLVPLLPHLCLLSAL